MSAVAALPRRLLQHSVSRAHSSYAVCGRRVLLHLPSIAPAPQARGFASAAASKVAKTLQSEIKHESEQYEQPKEIKSFLKETDFKFIEKDGDVNMALERSVAEKVVRIEWQLSSPYSPEADEEGEDMGAEEGTDFVLTVESKDGSKGISFYCSTQSGEDHRYIIGHVKSHFSAEEKESVSAYNGPDFEDVDDKLQEAFDEFLLEVGLNSSVCDFIDAMALDKEQREYLRWLNTAKTFLDA
mmetsp:Transcript_10206/g.16585  ORF Transcript_10206/g.16585 Transcript_10206/m.16585 type:complete len:241 (-) Transcript_10206:30-752(-)|eukprot:CAMPEP_0169349322 /NCGR_PEP_ID=MMETSP1017-20121227/23651_1 /TAXON_ID=342587 /ORGANISM="Karlodinium micrum, Strain CCMP2283" /LENGTH=240 /DNA_ID=CAMNT_0009445443 /DNA_START=87 /DNA_END=809 /DNA_ORIENTATION=-